MTEGVVEVRAAGKLVNVRAGEHWPTDCADQESAIPVASRPDDSQGNVDQVAPEQHAPAGPALRPLHGQSPKPATPERDSALVAQNDLFAEGVALRRQGNIAGALRAYDDLMTRFPSSPLVENAIVERMRLFVGTGDARAASEAKRYVARYPHGFALEEAQRLTETH